MDPIKPTDELHRTEDRPARLPDWTAADLIDLEYYLDADERLLRDRPSSRRELAARDRAIYLEQIEPELGGLAPHTPAHRRLSLRLWLKARRKAEDPAIRALLPGLIFARAQRLALILLAFLGFIAGISLTSTLLDYDGHLPVSVPWFIFLLVILQFALSLGAALTWLQRLLRRERPRVEDTWLLGQVLHPAFERIAQWLQGQQLVHIARDQREQVLATQGLIRAHFSVYEPLAVLNLFIPLQVFGVAFNLGVILTAILLEWFTDIAFGWGTSLAAHPQTIYDLVRLIAAPWGWLFGEGVGYPTLEQIEGSRVYLEQWALLGHGFEPNPEHLRAWRWFLVLAVFTYGLLPRLALLGGSLAAQHLTLKRLTFTHGRTQALYARMLAPHLDTRTGEAGQGAEMHIPAEIPVERRRSALIGPLPPGKSPVAPRPWREPRPSVELPSPPQQGMIELAGSVPSEAPKAPAQPAIAVSDAGKRGGAPAPLDSGAVVTAKRDSPLAELDTSHPVTSREIGSVPTPETLVEPGGLSPSDRAERGGAGASQVETALGQGLDAGTVSAPASAVAQERRAFVPATQDQVGDLQPAAPEPRPSVTPPVGGPAAPRYKGDGCVVLIHVDIDDLLAPEDRERLAALLQRLTGWQVGATAPFGAGSQMTARALALIEEGIWESPPPRVAVIQDGSQPPITENLVFLRELRAAAGPKAQLLVALVGDPDEEDRLPPLRIFDYRDWQAKIDQMADPYLRLEMLNPPEEDGED